MITLRVMLVKTSIGRAKRQNSEDKAGEREGVVKSLQLRKKKKTAPAVFYAYTW